jgi:hypothetical protein
MLSDKHVNLYFLGMLLVCSTELVRPVLPMAYGN